MLFMLQKYCKHKIIKNILRITVGTLAATLGLNYVTDRPVFCSSYTKFDLVGSIFAPNLHVVYLFIY